ncbi:MAG TPA: hypothetical protein PKD26_07685 [Pyrinomonadaceae bacterium]|nr:hypothetical protein [Pyrinomonadaceae bacterium]
MKVIFLLFAVFAVGVAVFTFADVRQGIATRVDKVVPSATRQPRFALPRPTQTVESNAGEPATIFDFVIDSDYVIIASPRDGRGFVRRDGPQPGSKDFDHKYWSGATFSLDVESLLFSKEAFENEALPIPVSSMEVFQPPLQGLDGGFVLEKRYLLFVQKVPRDDDVFSTFTIEPTKTYHRVVIGNRSLFDDGKPTMHSGSKRGSIYLERVLDAELVPAITQLCNALSLSDKKARIERLQELSKSENQRLRTNAEYALRHLSKSVILRREM